ncbi:hypothetical protein [Fluoribacter gormanii]|uniref:Uncharacterized protein n=1 Tax=Fluoribacter gormanii TaxID=464 RepID=A0A377GEN9_9GAMM|nr:hypothetical protein [Fluoribacter gormanii]KTD01741.1 hypothetical protein Lgor_2118 [Fluoribacter gormanii]SIR80086.1 hypothetical protein SAMN05421777_12542 [Fluoribacter gormanii]STO23277.1 Uncharacterised protein [Fluoribacter gormanii]
MNSKEELSRQYQDKKIKIDEQKEIILHLQQMKTEKEKAVETFNQKNKVIIENEVPSALNTAKINPDPVHLDPEEKQAVLDYIQEQLSTLSKEKQHNEELLEKSKKLNDLLEQVLEHLKAGYNKNTLADLTNKSGITSTQAPQNSGFALLLEILEEDPRKYTWTRDSTDRQNLLKVVPQKIQSVAFALGVDKETSKELTSALETLEQIQIQLVRNYDEHDKLSEEVVLLAEQIRQIETVTVKELTAQAEELERQIEELDQQEQKKQEQERERREQQRQEQANQRERLRQKAEQEKKERGTLALELKKLLIEYIDGRKQHYSTKDFFLPGDKKTREQFIDKIVNAKDGLLKKYVDSGNSNELLNTITAQISNFHGIKMQATLNRIVVKLIEAESKPVEIEDLPAKAKGVLSSFEAKKGKYKEYAVRMKNIYNKIEGINAYAKTLPKREQEVINQLIEALKKDVNQFVWQNSEQLPENKSYQKFKMNIKARLHSHDDLMSGHTSWSDTILNLLLSVITLGKLICSKATSGRASLFFDKTEEQKEIEAPIDVALENLGRFLAGG